MYLAGVDLAWQSERNASAVAIGEIEANVLHLRGARTDIRSLAGVKASLDSCEALRGVAIDAPLIITNTSGQRPCEKLIGRAYGARKASCHPSNLSLYPNAASVQLAQHLAARGFAHLGKPESRWQLECYPHPTLIEVFGLPERLAYKKGSVAEKRVGQARLAGLLHELRTSRVLSLRLDREFAKLLDPDRPAALRGAALKGHEDLLDSVVCLYVAGLYAHGVAEKVYGDAGSGYVYIPEQKCV